MSEYWKSIDKIYCNFCKVWYQDNKSSKDFHEKGFKHKNNVRRHLYEMQRKSTQNKKDEEEYNYEMKKIEQAALNAFQKDIAKNPSLINNVSFTNFPKTKKEENSDDLNENKTNIGRFGDEDNMKFRKNALDLITDKFIKKSEWFEAKTIEGKIYYFNKVTSDIKWKAPKCGFVSIEEQVKLGLLNTLTTSNETLSETNKKTEFIKHEQFGKWQEVQPQQSCSQLDLQLPKVSFKPKETKNECSLEEDEVHEFKEKVINPILSKTNKKCEFGFKKRKLNDNKNLRIKKDD